MKRAFTGVASVAGVLIAIAGLIVCMCDTPDVSTQLWTTSVGFVMFAAGVGIVYCAGKKEGNAYGNIR